METSPEPISSRKEKLNALIIEKNLREDDALKLINRESLLDTLQVLYDECSIEAIKKVDRNIANFVDKYKNTIHEVKRIRVNMADFEIKGVIGRGYFGEVHAVKEKQTGDIYAMKTIRKCDSLKNTSFEVERDIMAFSDSSWLTSLQYAFQDSTYLVFVMEFHPGGDLLNLLYKNGGTLPESAATFYLAELVQALEDLHGMGYVHRDIKPDNILLDRCGHLKLADFGSAAKLNSHGLVSEGPPVGTPDYVAPEVLHSVEGKSFKNSSYGVSCDYWSLGVLAYELTVGKTPFSSHNTSTTYARIMNHANSLKFPSELLLTQAFILFVKSLITDVKSRLNQQQIREHPLFKNINFDTIRDQVPPFVPKITSDDDTSNFVDVPTRKSEPNIEKYKKRTNFSGQNLPFIGFSYTKSFNSMKRALHKNSFAKDEIIKSLRNELEDVRRDLIKNEDFEEIKLNLEKKIAEQSQKIENVENVRSKLERELATCMAENAALKRTLEVERKDRAELEMRALDLIKSAKAKWETSERSKVESLKLEIEHQRDKIVQLSTTNNMLNEQLQRALKMEDQHHKSLEVVENLSRRSVIGLESRLDKITAENKTNIAELQSSLSESKHQKQLLEAEVDRLMTHERKLQEKLKDSQRSYKELDTRVGGADKVIRELSQKVLDLESEMQTSDNLRIELDQLRKELESCHLNNKNLELKNSLLETENKSLDVLRKEIESLKRDNLQLDNKIAELEQRLAEERNNCQSFKKQVEDTTVTKTETEELRELRVKFWKMEKEYNNCKIDKRILEREQKDAQNQIKQLTEQVDQLNKSITENKRAHDRALMEMNHINESLSMELMKCKESCKNLEEMLSGEKKRSDGEKTVINELKELIRMKDVEVDQIKTKMDKFKGENLQLLRRSGELEKEKESLVSRINQINKENLKLRDEVKSVEGQMKNTQLNLEALREACVLLENQVVEFEKLNDSIEQEKASLKENTEKLIADLCKAKQETQEAKKQYNEEKSLRLSVETKVKRLNEDIDCLQNECSSYKNQCVQYRECSNNLNDELSAAEEKISDLEVTLKSYERRIDDLVRDNNLLKEEISRYLTQISSVKESNLVLRCDIEKMKFNINVQMRKYEELEKVSNAKIAFYEERDWKQTATIKQQTKLIDYLQVKVDEHGQKKKTFTLFRHSKKENQPPQPPHSVYRDLEEQLEKQKDINKTLQDKVNMLKVELSCKTPKNTLSTQDSKQSHRLENQTLKDPQNCPNCLRQIPSNTSATACMECGIVAHPVCWRFLKEDCMPPIPVQKIEIIQTPPIIEGWLKVLNETQTWRKCYVYMNETRLGIFTSPTSQRGTLIENLDLMLPAKRKKIIFEPTSSEIGMNVPGNELPLIWKVELTPESTVYPPVAKVFMALSDQERDKWFEALRRVFNVDADQHEVDPFLTIHENFYVNCVTDLTKNIQIVGTDRGIFSYYNNTLLSIGPLSEVHQISIISPINTVIMIANSRRTLIYCDLNHLINLTQCAPCIKPTLTYKEIVTDMEGFHFLQASEQDVFCAANQKQLTIIKCDPENSRFVPLRIVDTAEPISCALFAESSLIVGADKFFEIDLKTFRADEFLDNSDPKLMHALRCYKLKSFPMGILEVQPRVYLLCFKEFTVFVDENGRSLPTTAEIKSNCCPFGFYFIDPYLYIVKFSGVEILKITEELFNSREGAQVTPTHTVELKDLRYVGQNKKGVYVMHQNSVKLIERPKILDDSLSVISQSDCNDRFSFTSSIVQSLDGHQSDNESVDTEDCKSSQFSVTDL